MLCKDPFLALLLWYSKKVGAALERDESVLMGKQSRNKGATDEPSVMGWRICQRSATV
jgi:hypothetical protein